MSETIKVYPATKAQVEALDAKIEPVNLSSVHVKVLDFINDPVTIISGGLDTYERIISN